MVLNTDVLVAELAARAEEFTGSDIAAVCQRAAMRRIHEVISAQESYDDSTADRFAVERADFEAAMEEMQRLKTRVARSADAARGRRPPD
jgi:SpoVK/Ycf46/Vps4 family AAA+-type ATPase